MHTIFNIIMFSFTAKDLPKLEVLGMGLRYFYRINDDGTVNIVNLDSIKIEPNDRFIGLRDEDMKVLEFVKVNTAHFDSSHGWEHAMVVAFYATQIMQTGKMLIFALLHDVCDHKYLNSISQGELDAFIATTNYPEIKDLIPLVSWSKQNNQGDGIYDGLSDDDKEHLIAIQTADRIQAIGAIGIERCFTYTRTKNPDKGEEEIKKLVVKHCNEKLIRLLPENFIRKDILPEYLQEEVIKHHDAIVSFVNDNQSASM